MENEFLRQACYIRHVISNQHTDFLRYLFAKDSLKIKKGLELVSRPHFSYKFLIFFVSDILYKAGKFHYQTGLFCKIFFVFHAWVFDDVLTLEFPCFTSAFFRHTIKISNSWVDTTIKEFKKFKLRDFSSVSPVLLHTQYWDVYIILVPWFLTDCTENEH